MNPHNIVIVAVITLPSILTLHFNHSYGLEPVDTSSTHVPVVDPDP